MAVLPITITGSPLPDVPYTPQEFYAAIIARLALETGESYVLIGTGSVLPVSDQGPFMLNGTTMYVWDTVSGSYVPQTIEFQADLNPKPWRGDLTANQTIVLAGAGSGEADLAYTEVYDNPGGSGVFDASTFIAPDDGFYAIKAKMGISATTPGAVVDSTVLFYPKKNTFQMPKEQVFLEINTAAKGQTYQIDTEIQLQAGDSITMAAGVIADAASTWTITAQDTWISGHKIRNLTF